MRPKGAFTTKNRSNFRHAIIDLGGTSQVSPKMATGSVNPLKSSGFAGNDC
jgi:hypothetical protein